MNDLTLISYNAHGCWYIGRLGVFDLSVMDLLPVSCFHQILPGSLCTHLTLSMSCTGTAVSLTRRRQMVFTRICSCHLKNNEATFRYKMYSNCSKLADHLTDHVTWYTSESEREVWFIIMLGQQTGTGTVPGKLGHLVTLSMSHSFH